MTRNPQAAQMADPVMLKNLAAQAAAIWPQEEPLLARYTLPQHACIADIGCGSGEISARLARRYPEARVIGIDILPGPVAFARREHAGLAPRLSFEQGDAFALRYRQDTFDLVVCRHLTQAVPEPELLLQELVRVCKPGGWVHLLSEDYGMLHFPPGRLDPDRLWQEGVAAYSRDTSTDERIGRRTWSLLTQLGLENVWVDYAVVDPLRVPRETMAVILHAWHDVYAETLQATGEFLPGEVASLFDLAIDATLDPKQYAVWHVPIISGQKPQG
ncbi:MAG: class I SAM-dependent methyltransferase [Pseudorhodoplanes sp.]|jgi:SAM-dependent methyltransferase|nr:class I SAM-dependent methyltransferase [Pseudorhodoplanes sp.]